MYGTNVWKPSPLKLPCCIAIKALVNSRGFTSIDEVGPIYMHKIIGSCKIVVVAHTGVITLFLTGLGEIAVISLIIVRFSNRKDFWKAQDLSYLVNSRKLSAHELMIL